MGPNELLFWLSARSAGSWPQFKSAVEEIFSEGDELNNRAPESYRLHQRLRFNLQSLAHVEFDAADCENGWRVTPPVLTLTRLAVRGTAGVLCGARLPETIRRFEGLAGATCERYKVSEQPDVVRVSAPCLEPLVALAETAGIKVQPDASVAILSCLPPLDSLAVWRETPLPFGKDWEVKYFEIKRRSYRWTGSSVAEANRITDGLFQFMQFQTYKYFLRVKGRTFMVGGQAGKFFLLAKHGRQVVHYNRNAQCLAVPAILRPPYLLERALVLCSGFLPDYDATSRMLVYREIPEGIAGFAAHILRQPSL